MKHFACSCASSRGRTGGEEILNLTPLCTPSIDGIMHVLGFGQEENRRDRDYYMAFNWTNVPPGIKISNGQQGISVLIYVYIYII